MVECRVSTWCSILGTLAPSLLGFIMMGLTWDIPILILTYVLFWGPMISSFPYPDGPYIPPFWNLVPTDHPYYAFGFGALSPQSE